MAISSTDTSGFHWKECKYSSDVFSSIFRTGLLVCKIRLYISALCDPRPMKKIFKKYWNSTTDQPDWLAVVIWWQRTLRALTKHNLSQTKVLASHSQQKCSYVMIFYKGSILMAICKCFKNFYIITVLQKFKVFIFCKTVRQNNDWIINSKISHQHKSSAWC